MAGPQRQGEFNGLALIAGGAVLVGMSLGGYAIGLLIGRLFNAEQIGAIIGLVVGTAVGFWDFYRIASQIFRRQPIPSEEEQRQAEEKWKKSENSENSEGARDKSHE